MSDVSRVYSLLRRYKGTSSEQYSITVPAHIARLLVGANVRDFTVELTDDGLVYRPAKEPADRELPAWLKEKNP